MDFRSIKKKNHSFYKFLFKRKDKIIRKNHFETQKMGRSNTGQFLIIVSKRCELELFQLRSLHLLLLHLTRDITHFQFFANFVWPKTSKPSQRMGTGKGKIHHWVAYYAPGDTFLELNNVTLQVKKKIFRFINNQLPIKFNIIRRLS